MVRSEESEHRTLDIIPDSEDGFSGNPIYECLAFVGVSMRELEKARSNGMTDAERSVNGPTGMAGQPGLGGWGQQIVSLEALPGELGRPYGRRTPRREEGRASHLVTATGARQGRQAQGRRPSEHLNRYMLICHARCRQHIGKPEKYLFRDWQHHLLQPAKYLISESANLAAFSLS